MTPLALHRRPPALAGGTAPTESSALPISARELFAWRERLGPRRTEELLLTLNEPDPTLRNGSLRGFARRLENSGDLQIAAELYARLDDPRAVRRLRDLSGNGSDGFARAELQFRQIAGQTFDPANLLPMLGAGLVFRAAQWGSLRWVLRGMGGPSLRLGRSALAGLASLSLEATCFTLLHRGMRGALHGEALDAESLSTELISSHLNFAALRLGASTLGHFSPLLGLLLGVTLAQRLEIATGIVPQQGDDGRVADILATSAQFYLTGRLMEHFPLLQRIWARAERWAYRSPWLETLRREGRTGNVDLSLHHRARFLSALEAAASGKVSEEATQDQLVGILREDYLEKVRGLGLQIQEVPWKQWLRQQSQRTLSPLWVARALVDPRGDDWKVHLLDFNGLGDIPDSNASMRDCESLTTSGGLHSLIETELGLPRGSLIEPRMGSGFSYLLPVEFLWRSAEYRFGSSAVQAEVLPALASQEHLGSLATANRRPVMLSGRYWNAIHNVISLHPYVAWEHDIYHLLEISSHAPAERREIADLYGILRWARPTDREEQSFHAELMESLLDGVESKAGDHSSLFYRIFSQTHSRGYRDAAMRLLRTSLPPLPRGMEILRQAERADSSSRPKDTV